MVDVQACLEAPAQGSAPLGVKRESDAGLISACEPSVEDGGPPDCPEPEPEEARVPKPSVRLIERVKVAVLISLISICRLVSERSTPDCGAEETQTEGPVENASPNIAVMNLSPSGEEKGAERGLRPASLIKVCHAETIESCA